MIGVYDYPSQDPSVTSLLVWDPVNPLSQYGHNDLRLLRYFTEVRDRLSRLLQ